MKRSRLGIRCDRRRLSPVVGVALVALVAAACGATQNAVDGPSRAATGANGAFSTFPGWDGNPANAINWNYGSGQHRVIDCYKNTPTEKNKNVFSVAAGDALPLSSGQLDEKHIANRDVAWPAVMDLNIEPLRALRLATNTSGLRVPNTDPGSGDGTKAADLGTGPFAAPGSTASPGNTCEKDNGAGQFRPAANPNLCLDVQASTLTDGAPIHVYDCNDSTAQQWVMTGDNRIRSGLDTAWCLRTGTPREAGGVGQAVVSSKMCFDRTSTWRVDGDGSVRSFTGTTCLDVDGSTYSSGAQLKLSDCSGPTPTENQKWITTPEAPSPSYASFATLRPSMRFRMKLKRRGKCVDLNMSKTDNGTPIKEEDCNGNPAQDWDLLTDGTIRTALDGGKCLHSAQRPTGIQECGGWPNPQRWKVHPEGTISLASDDSICLDSGLDPPWINMGRCNGGDFQHIEFERVDGDSGQWEVTGPKPFEDEPGIALNGSAGWRNAGSDFSLKGGCAERQDTVVACEVTKLASGDDRRVGLVGAYLWTLPIRLTIANDTSAMLVLRSAEAPAPQPGDIGVPGTELRNAVAASDEVRIPASPSQGQPLRGSIGWLRKFNVPGAQAGLDYSSGSPASSSDPATLAAVKDDKPFKLIVTVRVINQNALEDLYDGHPIQDAVEDCVAGTRKPWVSEQQFSDNCYDQKLGIAAAGPSGGDPPKPDTPSDKLSYQNLEMTWNPPPMAAAARGARANTVPCQEGPELCFAPDPQYPVANMGAAAMSTGDNGFIDIAVTVKKGDGFRYYDLQTSRLE